MLKEFKLRVSEITKIKQFDNSVVFYTANQFWVCEKNQPLPTKNDLFITLQLKGKSDNNG
jgi:hypothetical protein